MTTRTTLLRSAFVVVLCLPACAFADGERSALPPDRRSANFNKAERLLPGEELVSPTGKKMKVWSTTGPVPVSQAPEPFDDKTQQIDGRNMNVVVTPGDRSFRPRPRPRADSFDVRR